MLLHWSPERKTKIFRYENNGPFTGILSTFVHEHEMQKHPARFYMFHLKFFYRPAGISSSRPQFGHEASSSVQSQSAPDQVGPELGLGLVPPGSGPVSAAAHFHRSLPARRVGTHVLHVP